MPSTGTRVNLNVNQMWTVVFDRACCAHEVGDWAWGGLETALGGRGTAFGICNP